jgi:signal transduction histidine kinase
MLDPDRKRLRRTTTLYWLLLLYVIAALIWWFIVLENQNREMAVLQYQNLESKAATLDPRDYEARKAAISIQVKKNTAKYIAEGVTFLLLILAGASFVYRSIRRQFTLQLQQQNFMMAVTHELKTPISVARLNLETLLKYSLDPEKQKKLLKKTLDETGRLNFLTNNILMSAQFEGGGYQLSKEDLDLSRLLQDCINDFRNRFPERKIVSYIEEEGDVKGDSLLLQMLINNLIENALKYSPREQPVSAHLTKKKGSIILEIIDRGAGIDDDEKNKIFTKFYRVGNEFTRKAQGTGLGLYLCKKIAKDHNADIVVTNNTPVGSIFTVVFHS